MDKIDSAHVCCGILLAAGRGKRFDPSGQQNKLLQILPNGKTVIAQSAQVLWSVLPNTTVIIDANVQAVSAQLSAQASRVFSCADSAKGMAHSLLHGLQHLPANCTSFIIALADMPFVLPSTYLAIDEALQRGANIVVPVHSGRRGNPVGFSIRYLPRLLSLRGDQGARQLLQEFPVTEIELDDAGVLRDIDLPNDLF